MYADLLCHDILLINVNYWKSQYLSTRFSQNALQTCSSLKTLISLLIVNSVEKKKSCGSIITQSSNKK